MRTMLILVIICSLAQFAHAQRPTLPEDVKPPHECENIYKCYMPEMCTDSSKSMETPTLARENAVSLVTKKKQLLPDCPALIKFHPYGKHWAHVSIESFDAKIDAIKFTMYGGPQPAEFSCIRTSATEPQIPDYQPQKRVNKIEPMKAAAKLHCIFDVKLATTKQIFDGLNLNGEFVIDSMTTDQSDVNGIKSFLKCDPSNFKLKDPNNEKKVYSQVQHKPDEYSCDYPEISEMEYRKEEEDEYKVKIGKGKLTCIAGQFSIDTGTSIITIEKNSKMDIRCVADVKYFCDTKQVKEKDDIELLEKIDGNKETGIASKLKCPETHRHLFVRGKPKLGKPIECFNYGNKQLWRVDGQQLTSKAPEVYCSDKVHCKLIYKIPESHVDKGTLDEEYRPICPGGELQDMSGNKIEKTECDESTGDFKYYVGTEEKTVDRTTKFKCYYEEIIPEEQNKKNEEKMTYGIVIAGVVSGVATVLAVFLVAFLTRRAIRKQRKRMEEADNLLFVQFAMNRKEQAAARKKDRIEREKAAKNKKTSKSSENPKEKGPLPDKWNDFELFTQFRAMVDSDGPDGQRTETIKTEVITKDTTPSVIDTLPKLLFSGDPKKNKNLKEHDAVKKRLVKVLLKKEADKKKKQEREAREAREREEAKKKK